jgi:hypothetical protein
MHETPERPKRLAIALACALAAATAACGKNATTTAAPTAPSATAVAPTTTDEFDDTVPVGGSTFYAFSIAQYGTVNLTLSSVQGSGVPATVMLGVGIGTPAGTDCTTTNTVNTAAGATAQLTGAYGPGVFCAKVSDIGNLFAPATFTLSIAHP